MAWLQIARYEAARVVPQGQGGRRIVEEGGESKGTPHGAEGHHQDPQRTGVIPRERGDPGPGDGGDNDPTDDEGSSRYSDYRRGPYQCRGGGDGERSTRRS